MSKYSNNAKSRKWTEEEVSKLEQLYLSGTPYKAIADRLNRSPASVAKKASDLGMAKSSLRYVEWSDNETRKLLETYEFSTTSQLVEIFPHHSLGSIQKKAEKLGFIRKVKDRAPWTQGELDKLAELYQLNFTVKEISGLLGRTQYSVKIRIGKINAEELFWSEDEVAILRQHYCKAPNEELEAMLPKRSANMITKKANSLGLYKPPSLLWAEEEVGLLKEKYPVHTIEELEPMFPDKTRKQINKKSKAHRHKENVENFV